jgi:ABC-type antimicrobial peptide transport system permease subunit
MIERGGFLFASTMAESEEERRNPWILLKREFDDGAVPVIGDESAVIWQFHLGVGKDLVITDERGQEVHLRFVALLGGSVLQNELVVAESRFVQMFPSFSGHAFFLLDAPPARAQQLALTLEQELSVFAFDVTPTVQRLREYMAIQNTYLSTFQTLGGLGLVLGTIGLAVVLLRNVWERRSELALMRTLGFSPVALGWMVLVENAVLVIAGLAAGTLPALVAIAPHIAARPGQVPWLPLGLTLLSVLVVGVGAGAVALAPTLRAPLIPALRKE